MKLEIGGKMGDSSWIALSEMGQYEIKHDLRSNLPINLPDNSLTKFFSSHCIEHINNESVEFLFKDLSRLCQDGCILRVSCPDADFFIEQYKSGVIGALTDRQTPEQALINWFVSYEPGSGVTGVNNDKVKNNLANMPKHEFLDWAISHVDEKRPYIAHRNWFDYDKLEGMLKMAGFKNIHKCRYQGSSDEEMKNFDLHPSFSLFVECEK